MNASGDLNAAGLAIIYGGFGAVALGCVAVGVLQWKLRLRWPAGYTLWTTYLFALCNTGSYLVDSSRYASNRFWASFFAPLPFSAISVAVIWLSLLQARGRIDRAFSRVDKD